MFTLRIAILFIHVAAVIVALGGSLFSTFVVTPIISRELEAAPRIRVARGIIRKLGAIVLIALAVLVITGIVNVVMVGEITPLLALKLLLVALVLVLAIYQYDRIGVKFLRASAAGPDQGLAEIQARFRRIGLTVGVLVLVIVYLSLGITRVPQAFTIAPPP